MKELKFVEKEDLYVGDAFEGTHNYYNYCRDSFIKESMDFTKKFYENHTSIFDFDLDELDELDD